MCRILSVKCFMVLCCMVCMGFLPLAGAETMVLVTSDGRVEPYDAAAQAKMLAPVSSSLSAHGLTFNITYADNGTNQGFDDPSLGPLRKAVLEAALTYLADIINVTGTLDVLVDTSINNGGSPILASAGTYYPTSDGFYAGATRDAIDGGNPNSDPEIFVEVNWAYTYHLSNDPPVVGQFDLLSLLIHELIHGLGMLSLISSTGTSEFQIPYGSKTYTIHDALLFRRTTPTFLIGSSPPSLQVDVGDLTGDDVAFDGANAFSQYGQGTAPGIHAPSPFSGGSSMSHWVSNIVGGAVMVHSLPPGVERRTLKPVDVGALIDLGYVRASTSGAAAPFIVIPEGEGEKDSASCGPAGRTGATQQGDALLLGLLLLGFAGLTLHRLHNGMA